MALVLHARRALAARPPAVTEPPLLADAHLIHEPECHPLAGMGLGGGRQGRLEPPFSKRCCAFSSVFGWVGRVFWREKPSRLRMRDRLCGGKRLSKRSSIQRQRSASVQLLIPSVS